MMATPVRHDQVYDHVYALCLKRWFGSFFLRQNGGHHGELKQRDYGNGSYQVVSSQHVTRSLVTRRNNSDDPTSYCHFDFAAAHTIYLNTSRKNGTGDDSSLRAFCVSKCFLNERVAGRPDNP